MLVVQHLTCVPALTRRLTAAHLSLDALDDATLSAPLASTTPLTRVHPPAHTTLPFPPHPHSTMSSEEVPAAVAATTEDKVAEPETASPTKRAAEEEPTEAATETKKAKADEPEEEKKEEESAPAPVEEEEVDEDVVGDLAHLDQSNIIEGRRTRGKKIDYSKVEQPDEDEDEDDEDAVIGEEKPDESGDENEDEEDEE